MGKEELMKFVNDPFWVRLRWALFIGFWLLWLAMLVGAIVIIVVAPKCSAPEPKKLWEESPIIQLDISDSPDNHLNKLEPILGELKDLHVKAISLSSLIKQSSDGMHTLKKEIMHDTFRLLYTKNLNYIYFIKIRYMNNIKISFCCRRNRRFQRHPSRFWKHHRLGSSY